MMQLLLPSDSARLKEQLRRHQQLLLAIVCKAACGVDAAAAADTAGTDAEEASGSATATVSLAALEATATASGKPVTAVTHQQHRPSALPADPFCQGDRRMSSKGDGTAVVQAVGAGITPGSGSSSSSSARAAAAANGDVVSSSSSSKGMASAGSDVCSSAVFGITEAGRAALQGLSGVLGAAVFEAFGAPTAGS